jgi:hypothetical protein
MLTGYPKSCAGAKASSTVKQQHAHVSEELGFEARMRDDTTSDTCRKEQHSRSV